MQKYLAVLHKSSLRATVSVSTLTLLEYPLPVADNAEDRVEDDKCREWDKRHCNHQSIQPPVKPERNWDPRKMHKQAEDSHNKPKERSACCFLHKKDKIKMKW